MSNSLARPGLALAFSAVALAVSAPACAADKAPDIFGTFWATRYDAKIQIVGGGELPFTLEGGKAAYAANISGLKDGSITDAARKFCVSSTACRVFSPRPIRSRFSMRRPGRSHLSMSSTIRSARSRWTSRCRATRS